MTDFNHKIFRVNEFSEDFKCQGSAVVCYGHFNTIHPGHMRYLKYAKSLGESLIVVMQDDQMLKNDDYNNYFSEDDRAEGLSSLHIVDQVIILDKGNLFELINFVKPSILVLGSEHESDDDPIINKAKIALEKYNGQIIYHAGDAQYANTDLFHSRIDELEKEKIKLFKKACGKQNLDCEILQKNLSNLENTSILVIGDTIVDQYVGCDALGMSSEAPVLVVRELESKEYLGGAAIVAAHVKALGAKCHYLSVIGDDLYSEYVEKQLKSVDVTSHLIKDKSRPTTFKIRYMVEKQKLFRVSRLKEHKISAKVEDQLIEKIYSLKDEIDGIIVSDFVYGVITERLIDCLKDVASKNQIKLFADLQCSSQIGSVLKFENYDLIFPTEREARIALNNNVEGVEWIANQLLEKLSLDQILVKLGSDGFIAYSKQPDNFVIRQHFPALSVNPVDVTGAGDSMMAVIAACISSGSNLMEASAIGSCMASLSVREIGNTPISAEQLSNYMTFLFTQQ